VDREDGFEYVFTDTHHWVYDLYSIENMAGVEIDARVTDSRKEVCGYTLDKSRAISLSQSSIKHAHSHQIQAP
jgi:hypothetical protein